MSKIVDKNDPRYKGKVKNNIPVAESLKNTFKRVLTYWHDVIAPTVASGKKVLIVAHGNSLRALVKHFSNISDKDITAIKIPNGIPLIYEFNADLESMKKYYLGDIIISVPYAFRKCLRMKHGLDTELAFLTIHGFLHLIGFEHNEGIEEEEARIRKIMLEDGYGN